MITYLPCKPQSFIKSSDEVINNKYVRFISIASDTEYVCTPNNRNKLITTQIAFDDNEDNCVVLEHPTLKANKLPTWNTKFILNSILRFKEVDYDKNKDELQGYLVVKIKFFFAPADVLAGLFSEEKITRTIQKNCLQNARLNISSGIKNANNWLPLELYIINELGELNQIILEFQDFSKICGAMSLKNTAASLGIKMEAKNIMDNYKTNMLVPYLDDELRPEFIKYSKPDATVLFNIDENARQRDVNLFKVLGLEAPDKRFYTSGVLVDALFQAYLKKHIGDDKAYELHRANKKKMSLSTMLGYSTIDHFATITGGKGSLAANALVQGGRAKNERPLIFKKSGVIADADFSSCYVSIQKQLVYPVGIPNTYHRSESTEKTTYTLGRFLKDFGDDLEPRAYQILVEGELKNFQSIIPSKDIDTAKINSKYSEENPKIDAPFRIYQKQILNGVITSDVLEHLKWACSNKEWNEMMKLEVITAVWYPASKRCNTPKEWLEKTQGWIDKTGINEIVPIKNKNGTVHYEDERSKYWLAVPIKGFIEPFAKERKRLKKERDKHPKGSEKYLFYDAQQKAMKLVGNTFYGVEASPYFDIGNVVVANNITAIARCAVWGLNAAAETFQSITDGGAYDLNNVNYWDGVKPSMAVLTLQSRRHLLSKHTRNVIKQKPLLDELVKLSTQYNSETESEEPIAVGNKIYTIKDIDKILLAHIQDFFKGEDRPTLWDFISIEHKDLYLQIITHSQANYRLLHIDGNHLIKARGHKTEGTPYNGDTEGSNMINLFNDLDTRPNALPPYKPQTATHILKVNEANDRFNAKKTNIVQKNNLFAGDSILETKRVTPISLSMFHWHTKAQYDNWNRNNEKLKQKTGWGVEQFFLDDEQNLDYEKAVTTIQERIDDGSLWLVRNAKLRSPKIHPFKV